MSELDALVAQLQAGDDRALDQILSEIQPQLYRYSLSMCRHPEDAEDVLQESMLAVAKALRDFRGDAKLGTWLYTIARNFCIKQRRRSKFAPQHEYPLDDGIRAAGPDPEHRVEVADMWAKVQAVLHDLNEADREVIVLRDIQGLSAREVGDILDIREGAVKSRLHRARARLREGMAGLLHPRPGCPDIRRVFSEHLEGELSADMCTQMGAHVATCAACNAECEGLKRALHACSSAVCEVPPAVQQRVKDYLG